jgi:hypothetical protein
LKEELRKRKKVEKFMKKRERKMKKHNLEAKLQWKSDEQSVVLEFRISKTFGGEKRKILMNSPASLFPSKTQGKLRQIINIQRCHKIGKNCRSSNDTVEKKFSSCARG